MQPSPASDRPHLPWGPPLTAAQRKAAGLLRGAIDFWTTGEHSPDERDAALAGYSTSPAVWGVLLGRALRRVELGEGVYAVQVKLCRQFGADEEAAAVHLEWLRAQPGL